MLIVEFNWQGMASHYDFILASYCDLKLGGAIAKCIIPIISRGSILEPVITVGNWVTEVQLEKAAKWLLS